MKGVHQGLKMGMVFLGRGSQPQARSLGECYVFCSRVQGRAPAAQWFSCILSALDGVRCCVLGAFCITRLYAVQHGKGAVRFLEAVCNSNCDSIHYTKYG